MSLKVLILGTNGFIGSNLTESILKNTDWEVCGLDLTSDRLDEFLDNDRFTFKRGDMLKEQSWIDEQIQKCDIVMPLVAIASPAIYVKDPLRIFELDFEANLRIVRQCVKYKKRLIFPSTSEVAKMTSLMKKPRTLY